MATLFAESPTTNASNSIALSRSLSFKSDSALCASGPWQAKHFSDNSGWMSNAKLIFWSPRSVALCSVVSIGSLLEVDSTKAANGWFDWPTSANSFSPSVLGPDCDSSTATVPSQRVMSISRKDSGEDVASEASKRSTSLPATLIVSTCLSALDVVGILKKRRWINREIWVAPDPFPLAATGG